MKRLRIASLTTFYPPYSFGGDAVDVQRTARALARRGHEVTVIYDRDAFHSVANGRNPEPPPPDPEVEVIALESRLGTFSPLLTHQFGRPVMHGSMLDRLDRDRQFDVVLLNNMSLVGGPGLFGFGRNAVRLYIAHEHWLVCPSHVLWKYTDEACDTRDCLRCVLASKRPPQLWRYTGALTRALAHVDVFIARSEFSRRKHRDYGFSREMEVVPYFVPLPEQPFDGPSPHSRPYFFFAGRLEAIKGVDDLIRAFPPDCTADLLIAGDGTQEADLRALGAGHPRVQFLGRLPVERLAAYYRHALATVVPSRCYETFGLVVAEAFAQGTPVIARDIGPLPELIRTAGVGAIFGSNDELASVLRTWAGQGQPDRQLGDAARAAVARHWSEDAVIGRYMDIIERALSRRAADSSADAGTRSAKAM